MLDFPSTVIPIFLLDMFLNNNPYTGALKSRMKNTELILTKMLYIKDCIYSSLNDWKQMSACSLITVQKIV